MGDGQVFESKQTIVRPICMSESLIGKIQQSCNPTTDDISAENITIGKIQRSCNPTTDDISAENIISNIII